MAPTVPALLYSAAPVVLRSVVDSFLLSAINATVTFSHLKEIHARLIRLDLDQSSFIVSKVLRRLAESHVPMDPYPRLVFSQVRQPNSFLWTSLIRGYAILGPPSGAFLHYSLMRHSNPPVRPLPFTFSALFKLCGEARFLREGMQLHAQKYSVGGFDSDLYVGNTLIDMYIKCEDLASARRIFDEMTERDAISWTTIIVAYIRCADMGKAEKLFERSPVNDTVLCTAMLAGYAQNARPRDALKLFQRMLDSCVEIDEITLTSVISACSQLGAVTWAKWIHDFARKSRCDRSMVVGSAMIDMFGKCGLADEAWRIFEEMPEKNVYTYSAMISGYASNGCAHNAVELFEEMVVKDNVKPNDVTFTGLLTACSHAGMVEDGRRYFKMMTAEYGIDPTINHYACMADLLGRAGLVEEAYEMVKSMPMEPHGGVWGALLGACQIHGNVHIAEIAASHLFALEPIGIGNYVLLSNTYATAGMWNEVLKVRRLMRGKTRSKDPACSSVETDDGVVHDFFADDGTGTYPKSREIKEVLDKLIKRLKLTGYLPNLDSIPYDLPDEEKERVLKGHSEKLALAFGLLTTGVGGTIRIVKNVRVCMDCHMVMCLTSSVMDRKIVLRDNMRFHHFEMGCCSCSGFW